MAKSPRNSPTSKSDAPRISEFDKTLDAAKRRGITLGEYLNSIEVAKHPTADDVPGPAKRLMPEDAKEAALWLNAELDALQARLRDSQSLTARAISGIDKSVLGLMFKVDESGQAQLGALERVVKALAQIETAQHDVMLRLQRVEARDSTAAQTVNSTGLPEAIAAAFVYEFRSRNRELEDLHAMIESRVSGRGSS